MFGPFQRYSSVAEQLTCRCFTENNIRGGKYVLRCRESVRLFFSLARNGNRARKERRRRRRRTRGATVGCFAFKPACRIVPVFRRRFVLIVPSEESRDYSESIDAMVELENSQLGDTLRRGRRGGRKKKNKQKKPTLSLDALIFFFSLFFFFAAPACAWILFVFDRVVPSGEFERLCVDFCVFSDFLRMR